MRHDSIGLVGGTANGHCSRSHKSASRHRYLGQKHRHVSKALLGSRFPVHLNAKDADRNNPGLLRTESHQYKLLKVVLDSEGRVPEWDQSELQLGLLAEIALRTTVFEPLLPEIGTLW